jgi:hypothetical protein
MGEPVTDTKVPSLVAYGLAVLGIVVAAIGDHGVLHGSIWGGLISATGAIPACLGMWKGIQQETQGTLAMSVIAVLVALGVGAALIILRVVHWVS